MPSTLFNWAAAPALDLTSSCSSYFIFILLIIFYLYLLFIFSLSAHYIYLYLFFIFYLNLLLQGISLQLPYHLLSSVSKYRDGREASILDPTNWYYAFATSEICELIQGCKIHGSVSWRIMKQGMDMVCITISFFQSSFFDLFVKMRWSQLQRCLLGGS